MILSELKNKVVSLDYETASAVSSNAQLFADSVTQALATISTTVKGVEAVYEYTPTDNGLVKVDLLDLTKSGTTKVFDKLLYVENEKEDDVTRFSNYKLRFGHIAIFYDKDIEGKLEFIYRKRSQVITTSTLDTADIEIDYECEPMLPLLTAYYMWLDNDLEYASRWYNEYEKLANEYLANKPTMMRVRTDLWHTDKV